MEILAAIKGRRTVHGFRPDPVSRDQVEQMLEAAIWAPNHKLTNPWEFFVFSGAAKEKLARLRGELKRRKHTDPDSEQALRSYRNAYTELATVPWAVLVCQKVAADPDRAYEDLLAVGCAIQNLMLAAHAMGIGTFWGTGPLINHQETFRTLGVPAGRKAVGLILAGYAEGDTPAPAREPLTEHVHWVDRPVGE